MVEPSIPKSEYASRRKKALAAIGKSVALVYAGDAQGESFTVDPSFEYFTGIADEPGAILMLDGAAPSVSRRAVLFLSPRDPEVERWDGIRPGIGGALREATGIATIFRTPMFPRFLNEAIVRAKRCACLHPFATIDRPVSRDLETFRKVSDRVPGVTIEDRTALLGKLRSVKSVAEVRMLQRAVDLTAKGFEAALAALRPGIYEHEIQDLLEHTYRRNGSRRGPGYGTIVGGGLMATVLHYRANEHELKDGDLVCIDSGGTFGAYTADITRTYPVNGRFTDRQREIYDIVLKAEEAAIRAVRPGAKISDVHEVASKIIAKAGFGEYFIHGIGHHLGMQVHDLTPEGPLREGAVITIEPGIYLPDEAIGVRIEDDILITKTGSRNLSAQIPKKAVDIERAMSRDSTPARKKK
ncbi:MAG: aminopeptidase P family protein [Planctomycetes bacterium]|nr:aminopeptidase P family protein [Planctomycetota bacterium]